MSFNVIGRTDQNLFCKCWRRQAAGAKLRIICALYSFAGIASYRFVIAFFFILPPRCYLPYQRHNLVSARPQYLENSRQRVLLSNFHHFNDGLLSPKPLFDGMRVDFGVSSKHQQDVSQSSW